MKDTVKVNYKALFKVLDYLYKEEGSDYQTLLDDEALSKHARAGHIFSSIIQLVADANIDPDDFNAFTGDL